MDKENTKLVGRIDFLDFHKKVAGNTEYSDEKLFVENINDCINSGLPIIVVLYSDENGKTIPDGFKYDLIPFQQGLRIENMNRLTKTEYETLPYLSDFPYRRKEETIENSENTKLVGRIDFLDFHKKVAGNTEYSNEKLFIEDINDYINHSIPMTVVLYSDENGKTIPDDFKHNLIPFQQGLRIENISNQQEHETLQCLSDLLFNANKRKAEALEKLENIKLVGRIDWLDFNGKVTEVTEYSDEKLFIEDINDCIDSGVPMTVVLYSDENGKTIPDDFKYDLIPFRQGLHIEDSPVKEKDSCISL